MIKEIIKEIKKRLGKISLTAALLFTLGNMIFLLLFRHIIVRVAVFSACTIILYKLGKLPYADVDPVPFASALIYLWYGFPVAVQFAIWTIPASDVISGRISHYSLVNLIAVSSALTVLHFFTLPVFYYLLLLVFLFNIFRLVINLATGSGLNALIAPGTNIFLYFMVVSLLSPLIESSLLFFRMLV